MEWLSDDVIYGGACAVLLMLLIRELLATVAQYAPLSRTPSWLPSAVRHVIFSDGPLCENYPGVEATRKDVSTQANASNNNEISLHQGQPTLTSIPHDPEVKVKAECNGDISASSSYDCLRRKVDSLNAELTECRKLIAELRQTEQTLRHRFESQMLSQFKRDPKGRFENINLTEDGRATSLIRRYEAIYSEERVETLDVLEQLVLQGHSDTDQGDLERDRTEVTSPEQLLVSIVAMCFEHAQETVERLIEEMHGSLTSLVIHRRQHVTAADADDDDGDVITQQMLSDVDDAVHGFLRQTAAHRDLSSSLKVIKERIGGHVLVKYSQELDRYVTSCARLAWSLAVQRPSYAVEHQLTGAMFDDSRHRRFHSSEATSNTVKRVVWPALVERPNRFCVSKAVVVT